MNLTNKTKNLQKKFNNLIPVSSKSSLNTNRLEVLYNLKSCFNNRKQFKSFLSDVASLTVSVFNITKLLTIFKQFFQTEPLLIRTLLRILINNSIFYNFTQRTIVYRFIVSHETITIYQGLKTQILHNSRIILESRIV